MIELYFDQTLRLSLQEKVLRLGGLAFVHS